MRNISLVVMTCLIAVQLVWVCAAFSASPSGAESASVSAAVNSNVSVEHMAGQMIMVGFRGIDNAAEGNMPEVLDAIRRGLVGGLVLFNYDVIRKSERRNVSSLEQVAALIRLMQAAAPTPLFIAVDQEGGAVRRLRPEHGTPFDLPSAHRMGRRSPEETRIWGEKTGELLHSLGFNINFAPSVDVNVNSKSPAIGKRGRAFSARPHEVVRHARAFAEGLAAHNVIATYKHFPGHGSAVTDTHYGITDVTHTWTEAELIPYLPENRPHIPLMIMTGHLFHTGFDGTYPATLSANIITKVLRERLQWDGLVVSDDMQMEAVTQHFSTREAVRRAIEAGVDILVCGNNLVFDADIARIMHKYIMDLVREGIISEERIRQSYERIMRMKMRIGLLPS